MQTVDLPQASSDLNRLKADLGEFGYAVVAGALSLEQTRQIRARLSEQASLERKLGFEIADHVYDVKQTSVDHGPNQWVYGLVNKGDEFRITLDQPLVRSLITHALGREYILSDLTAHITHPGNSDMTLHTDQWWMPPPMLPGDADYIRCGDLSRDYAGHSRHPGAVQAADFAPVSNQRHLDVVRLQCRERRNPVCARQSFERSSTRPGN